MLQIQLLVFIFPFPDQSRANVFAGYNGPLNDNPLNMAHYFTYAGSTTTDQQCAAVAKLAPGADLLIFFRYAGGTQCQAFYYTFNLHNLNGYRNGGLFWYKA